MMGLGFLGKVGLIVVSLPNGQSCAGAPRRGLPLEVWSINGEQNWRRTGRRGHIRTRCRGAAARSMGVSPQVLQLSG